MSIRDFTRIYYAIEKNGPQTLVYPFSRIAYDEAYGALAIHEPAHPTEPITIELWQMAEQSDIDAYEWCDGDPITVSQAIDELIANSSATPWTIDGIDEQDSAGIYYDGHTARTFKEDGRVTLDDVRIVAYEHIDKDASERMEDYLLITDHGTVGIALTPTDATVLCGSLGTATADYMSTEALRRRIDLSPINYAVIEKIPRSQDWLLVAALDTLAHAQAIAERRGQETNETGLTGQTVIKEVSRREMPSTAWQPVDGWKGPGKYRGDGKACPRCESKSIEWDILVRPPRPMDALTKSTVQDGRCRMCGLTFQTTIRHRMIERGRDDEAATTIVKREDLNE